MRIMKVVFENKEIMILSDKENPQNDEGFITFHDGSSVDIDTRTIANKGPGMILIWDMPMWPPMKEVIKKQKAIPPFKHIIVKGGMSNIILRPSKDGRNYASIGGSKEYTQNCDIAYHDDELYIHTPETQKSVYVDYGSIWINGKRQPPRLEEDFGYIEILCGDVDGLYVNTRGQGKIVSFVPVNALRAIIKGSTSFRMLHLNNADVDISGSGNVSVSEFTGSLNARVSGSGSVDILTGLLNHADVAISGSGNLMIGAPVESAALVLSGSGNMMIAQVLNEYTARECGSGKIRVLQCG